MNVPTDISLQVVGSVAAALLVGQAARRMNRVLEPVNRRLLSGLRDR